MLKVNLVVFLLATISFIVINCKTPQDSSGGKRKINKLADMTKFSIDLSGKNRANVVIPFNTVTQSENATLNSTGIVHEIPNPKTDLGVIEPRRKHKSPKKTKMWNRTLTALLLAYKIKFAALIPTIIGGLILLLSSTAMAGFFFALFAAILGLRGT